MTEIIINGKERFRVRRYPLDTDTTLFNRVAWTAGSLPLYIHWDRETDAVTDLLGLVKTGAGIRELVSQYVDRFDASIIYSLWVVYNPDGAQDAMRLIESKYPTANLFRETVTMNSLNTKIQEFATLQEAILKDAIDVHKMSTDSRYVLQDFILKDRIINEVASEIPDTFGNINVLFSLLNPTYDIPVFKLGKIFKVLGGFKPIDSFDSSDDKIVGFTRDGDRVSIERRDDLFYITRPASIELPMNYNQKALTTDTMNGIITMKNSINMIVLADLLNKQLIRDYFAMNDRLSPLTDFVSRKLYMQHPHDTAIFIEVSISQQVSTSSDIFPLNTLYTQFRLKNVSQEQVDIFTYWLRRILYIYERRERDIVELYNEKGGTVDTGTPGREVLARRTRQLYMKDIEPLVFGTQYTRRCQPKNKIPRIIQSGEEAGDRMTLLFPKEEVKTEEGIIEQRTYVCDDPVYKYPGIVKVTDNAIGYAPCCFMVDPRSKKNYVEYYENRTVQVDKGTYRKVTDKLLAPEEIGFIPRKFTKAYAPLFPIETKRVVRKGVRQTPDSLIECIRLQMRLEITTDEMRDLLASKPHLMKQEMYNKTLEEISNYILSDEFIDVRYIVNAIPLLFGCNVLVLSQGSVVKPAYMSGYFRYYRDPTLPTVVLYEYSPPDISYPQYDVVFYVDTKDIAIVQNGYPFTWDEDAFLWKVLDEMTATYIGKKVKPIRPLPDVVGQYFDSHGKVRKLLTTSGVVDCSPLPPMDVQVYTMEELDEYESTPSILEYIEQHSKDGIVLKLPREHVGEVELYQFNERVSRVMKGWIKYLFSQYMHDTEEYNVSEFIQRYTTVQSDAASNYYESEFDYSFDKRRNQSLFIGNQLACATERMQNRLAYYIQMELNRNGQSLKQYRLHRVNPEYFRYYYDYEKAPNTLLTEYDSSATDASFQTLFKQEPLIAHVNPQMRASFFYFLVDGRVIATRAVDTINKALRLLLSRTYPDGNIPFEYKNLEIPFYLYVDTFDKVYHVDKEYGDAVFEIYQRGTTYFPILG